MVTLIPGDGIGPELAASVKEVFRYLPVYACIYVYGRVCVCIYISYYVRVCACVCVGHVGMCEHVCMCGCVWGICARPRICVT